GASGEVHLSSRSTRRCRGDAPRGVRPNKTPGRRGDVTGAKQRRHPSRLRPLRLQPTWAPQKDLGPPKDLAPNQVCGPVPLAAAAWGWLATIPRLVIPSREDMLARPVVPPGGRRGAANWQCWDMAYAPAGCLPSDARRPISGFPHLERPRVPTPRTHLQ